MENPVPFLVACPSCGNELRLTFSSCKIITCDTCGKITDRTNTGKDFFNIAPGDDCSLLCPGVTGSWNKTYFEITGRIRFEFLDESYVNWWHLDSSKGSLWIAESYASCRILQPVQLKKKLTDFEKLNPGSEISTGEDSVYYMDSISTAEKWKTEGQLPEKPLDKKFIWMSLSGLNERGLELHIYDRSEYSAFEGEDFEPGKLQLKNLRIINGWA